MIVQPGDKLFVPLLPDVRPTDEVKRALEDRMPGVEVVVMTGIGGGPFVYRGPRQMTESEQKAADLLEKMFSHEPSREDTAP